MSASSVARGARARVAPASRAEGAVWRARVPPTTLPQHSHPRTRASLVCPPLPTRVAVADRAALASRSRGRSAARAARQGGALFLVLSVADIERTKILNNEAGVRARARLLPPPPSPRARDRLSPRRNSLRARRIPRRPLAHTRVGASHHSSLTSRAFFWRFARRGLGGLGVGGSAAPQHATTTPRVINGIQQSFVRADAPVPAHPTSLHRARLLRSFRRPLRRTGPF